MSALHAMRNGLILSLAMLGLAACGGDNDDLDQYINEIKARPGGRIDPLPEITPYEIFTYVADAENIRSPFVPDTPQAAAGNAAGPRPVEGRSREYGLVQTSDGLIHRVVPGNYMGQNDGRITDISESEIEMVEIISDGIGGYIERDAAISLSD